MIIFILSALFFPSSFLQLNMSYKSKWNPAWQKTKGRLAAQKAIYTPKVISKFTPAPSPPEKKFSPSACPPGQSQIEWLSFFDATLYPCKSKTCKATIGKVEAELQSLKDQYRATENTQGQLVQEPNTHFAHMMSLGTSKREIGDELAAKRQELNRLKLRCRHFRCAMFDLEAKLVDPNFINQRTVILDERKQLKILHG